MKVYFFQEKICSTHHKWKNEIFSSVKKKLIIIIIIIIKITIIITIIIIIANLKNIINFTAIVVV